MKVRLIMSLALVLATNLAFADKYKKYEVSITNITKGQAFTPQLAVVHKGSANFFVLGEAASDSLEELAEGGNTAPLTADLNSMPGKVADILTNHLLLQPGMTTTFEISGHHRHHYFSFAAMLLPTNDAFVALMQMKLPQKGTVSRFARAYDAGTEENDQNCAHIPGPHCGGTGEGHSMGPNDTDEGYVYISNGFHDLGDIDDHGNKILGPMLYDWNNPVALVKITRIDKD